MKSIKTLIASICFFGMTACGGGGGGGGPAVGSDVATTAGGVWEGKVTYEDNSQEEMFGLISESGEGIFLTFDGSLSFGQVNTSSNTLTGRFTSFAPFGQIFVSNGESQISGSLTGSVNPRSSLIIDSFYQGTQQSTSSFVYDPIYARSSSLSKISGAYFYQEPGLTESLTINTAGDFTGSNSDGCVYSGSVSVIDSRYNAYDMSFEVSNCANGNGTYDGLATLSDYVVEDDLLIFAASNSTFALSGYFFR